MYAARAASCAWVRAEGLSKSATEACRVEDVDAWLLGAFCGLLGNAIEEIVDVKMLPIGEIEKI